jgi:predicted ribosome quality control (RQC) complex YloA/Tae2 family protein
LPEPNKRISLFDIYLNQPIDIEWQPDISAVDNADWYFQKAKAKPHKMALLNKKIADCKAQIADIQLRLTAIENAQNSKALKRLEKPVVSSQTQVEKPYRQFEFEGYTILVGKHAESNDQLLNQFSDKDDLWLHAKDVSGSHVIIKTKHQATPKPVIETAASLAAYFSKNRQQQMVTVMCTPRKYVRKLKGSKGLVHVSQEQTLLVNPKMP